MWPHRLTLLVSGGLASPAAMGKYWTRVPAGVGAPTAGECSAMSTTPQWPQMGWANGPPTKPEGMVHATYPGEHTALCGADTPQLGQPWPKTSEEWSFPYSRCPPCAHRLYTPDRH